MLDMAVLLGFLRVFVCSSSSYFADGVPEWEFVPICRAFSPLLPWDAPLGLRPRLVCCGPLALFQAGRMVRSGWENRQQGGAGKDIRPTHRDETAMSGAPWRLGGVVGRSRAIAATRTVPGRVLRGGSAKEGGASDNGLYWTFAFCLLIRWLERRQVTKKWDISVVNTTGCAFWGETH
jgi:hypothetical protein